MMSTRAAVDRGRDPAEVLVDRVTVSEQRNQLISPELGQQREPVGVSPDRDHTGCAEVLAIWTAIWTAIWPALPVAPRISTLCPAEKLMRRRSATQLDSAAATVATSTSGASATLRRRSIPGHA
jgi:hypothetical protein